MFQKVIPITACNSIFNAKILLESFHSRIVFHLYIYINSYPLSSQVQQGDAVPLWLVPWTPVLCSWENHFPLKVPLSIQKYKWVPANYQGSMMKCLA